MSDSLDGCMGNVKVLRFLPRFLATWCLAMTLGLSIAMPAVAQPRGRIDAARKKLVREEIIAAGVQNERVIEAMLSTPRHEFVPARYRKYAYFDMSLPIGEQQTISSPFIVAYMTEALDPQPSDRVLEIGTGSGYQAAVLSPLVDEVYSIEIVEKLGRGAAATLKRLRYKNVSVRVGDGFLGWPTKAPFDKIIVTCSPEKVPVPLVEQLKEGGRLVVPVGERYQQTLYLFRKVDGQLVQEALRPTLFVPMTGEAEANRIEKPDPTAPQTVNGSFEEGSDGDLDLAGWFYQRQVTRTQGALAPDQDHYATFHNETPDRASRALQGFAVDGRVVGKLELSAFVKYDHVLRGTESYMQPRIAITFYDEQRRDLGQKWLGPWRGSQDWHLVEGTIDVPVAAREGILRIGLFGATGTFSLDDVRMKATLR